METKKSEHANLEPKRFMFRELGFVIGLSLLFMVFEYSISSTTIESVLPNMGEKAEQEFTQITKIEDDKEMIKPKPLPTISQTIIEVLKPQEADTLTPTFLTDTVPTNTPNYRDMEPTYEPDPFFKLEKMPEFKGGDAALLKFIAQNM